MELGMALGMAITVDIVRDIGVGLYAIPCGVPQFRRLMLNSNQDMDAANGVLFFNHGRSWEDGLYGKD